jgi:hypothetical protein
MKLSDTAISHIAKVLQVAILTGTDIVDNFRLMEFELDNDELYLDKTYASNFEENLDKMLEEVEDNVTPLDIDISS